MKKKILTLCLVERAGEVLLGMKKRGFGEGRWNGYGGKVNDGEIISDAARRELREEVGIEALNLDYRGFFHFIFDDKPDEALEVHLFSTTKYKGEPRESEEIGFRWFRHDDVPYDEMWPDDKYWMPLVLEGKNLTGTVHFKDKDTIREYEFREI